MCAPATCCLGNIHVANYRERNIDLINTLNHYMPLQGTRSLSLAILKTIYDRFDAQMTDEQQGTKMNDNLPG
jgi:hypothetical protein